MDENYLDSSLIDMENTPGDAKNARRNDRAGSLLDHNKARHRTGDPILADTAQQANKRAPESAEERFPRIRLPKTIKRGSRGQIAEDISPWPDVARSLRTQSADSLRLRAALR